MKRICLSIVAGVFVGWIVSRGVPEATPKPRLTEMARAATNDPVSQQPDSSEAKAVVEAALAEEQGSQTSERLIDALSAWARIDGKGAIEWAEAHLPSESNEELLSELLGVWVVADLHGMRTWFEAVLPNSTSFTRNRIAAKLLIQRLALRDPTRAAEFLLRVEPWSGTSLGIGVLGRELGPYPPKSRRLSSSRRGFVRLF